MAKLTVKRVAFLVRGSKSQAEAELVIRSFAEQLISEAQKAIAAGEILDILGEIAKMRGKYLRERD